METFRKKSRLLLAVLTVAVIACGSLSCGQKGDLVLPDDQQAKDKKKQSLF